MFGQAKALLTRNTMSNIVRYSHGVGGVPGEVITDKCQNLIDYIILAK